MSKKLKDSITPMIDKIVATSSSKSVELIDEIIDYAEKEVVKATPRSGMTLARRQQLYRDSKKQAERQAYYTKPLYQSYIQTKLTGQRRAEPRKSLWADADNGWRLGFVENDTPNYRANNFLAGVVKRIDKKGTELIERTYDEVINNDT